MDDGTTEPFGFPAIGREKLTAAVGGRLTSDGGVLLLAAAERELGLCDRPAALIAGPRDPSRVVHPPADILRARILAIACGHEDADDLGRLRRDPGFKLACGRLPEAGRDPCSQPTVSRRENAPSPREVVRLMRAMADLYCASFPKPPGAVTLDIDDALDAVHGRQRLSLFNAHYDERCLLPTHVHDTAAARPVAVLLRPGKTPSGQEARGHLRRLARRIRRHWPRTHITLRGDGHYGRPEVMAFCGAEGIDYVFGPSTDAAPRNLLEEAADGLRVRRAEAQAPVLRRYAEARCGAKSWGKDRRVVARVEASTLGPDTRFVVASPARGSAEWVYDGLYCARGQAESLVQLHKGQLASGRTSCRSPLANQVRLILHAAAYWLLLTLRDRIPKPRGLAGAEFASPRLHLLKIAGRVIETAGRVRIALAAACPQAVLFRGLARSFQPAGP